MTKQTETVLLSEVKSSNLVRVNSLEVILPLANLPLGLKEGLPSSREKNISKHLPQSIKDKFSEVVTEKIKTLNSYLWVDADKELLFFELLCN